MHVKNMLQHKKGLKMSLTWLLLDQHEKKFIYFLSILVRMERAKKASHAPDPSKAFADL
jgi:hypothetical protein